MTLREWLADENKPADSRHYIRSLVGMEHNLDRDIVEVKYENKENIPDKIEYYFHLVNEIWYIYEIPYSTFKKRTRNSIW